MDNTTFTRLMKDFVLGMQSSSFHRERESRQRRRARGDDGPPAVREAASQSMNKEMFGDEWSFWYGVHKGEGLTRAGEFHKNYDEYGYGAYGDGLVVGRALYSNKNGNDFEFSKDESQDDELSFDFIYE